MKKEIVKQFEITFKNGETMQIRGAEYKNELAAYNYICAKRLGKGRGGIEKIEDVTCYFGE